MPITTTAPDSRRGCRRRRGGQPRPPSLPPVMPFTLVTPSPAQRRATERSIRRPPALHGMLLLVAPVPFLLGQAPSLSQRAMPRFHKCLTVGFPKVLRCRRPAEPGRHETDPDQVCGREKGGDDLQDSKLGQAIELTATARTPCATPPFAAAAAAWSATFFACVAVAAVLVRAEESRLTEKLVGCKHKHRTSNDHDHC